MRIFIFEGVDEVSGHYHSDGGLVIIAEDEARVKELVAEDEYIKLTEADWFDVISYQVSDDAQEKVFVFPDAGCC